MSGNSGFVLSLLGSATFYQTAGPLLLTALALLALAAVAVCRLAAARAQRVKNLLSDESGVSTVIDFTLTLPLFLFVVMTVVQLMIMINDALVVHYSAYSAARNARVWAQFGIDPAAGKTEQEKCVNNRVELAARLALIPAAPAGPGLVTNPEPLPASLLRAIARQSNYADRLDGLMRKARYAFDRANATVSCYVDEAKPLRLKAKPGGRLVSPVSGETAYYARPVSATVRFRVHLGSGIGRLFALAPGGGRRPDGSYYQTITATMTVL